MKRTSKLYAQHVHFQRRMIERQGTFLDPQSVIAIIRKIQSGESLHLRTQSNRVTIKGVKHNEKWFVVVYDKLRKSLVTILPETNGYYKKLQNIENSKD
ncbi:MAG: hypothetical protein Q7R33_04825 [Nitrosarchaeum sp.]|nr:hypothetical protein [Nitrosarchaeum sp.]